MENMKNQKTISLTIPTEIVRMIDQVAKKNTTKDQPITRIDILKALILDGAQQLAQSDAEVLQGPILEEYAKQKEAVR